MAERNRVTPFGEIVAIPQRGTLMGNRGSIHRGHDIVRPWQVRRWIVCRLDFRGWRAPRWEPGRWTPLFFLDEAVALAAGHRPCALCRHGDHVAWLDAWEAAFGERPRVDPIDRRLHADRIDGRRQRRHRRAWSGLPNGSFVTIGDVPALVLADRVVSWTPDGYGRALDRPTRGDAVVVTPAATVEVLTAGYEPAIHPAAKG